MFGAAFCPALPCPTLSFLIRISIASWGLAGFAKALRSLKDGFSLGLSFGFSFVFVSFFGIYKAFYLVNQSLLFVPCLSLLATMWGSMLGGVCAGQQAVLNSISKRVGNCDSAANGDIDAADETSAGGNATAEGRTTLVIQTKVNQKWDLGALFAISFVFSWTLFELLRSYVFIPFPWNLVAHLFSFEETNIARMFTPIVRPCGIYFLSTVWCLFVVSFFVEKSRVLKLTSLTAIGVVVLFGVVDIATNETTENYDSIVIIQPNIKQRDKLVRDNKDAILRKMIELTKKARDAAKVPPKLIIWPETAITHMVSAESGIVKRIMQEAVKDGEYLIFGADRVEQGAESGQLKWYNSMFVVSKNKVEYVYDKVRLLPFGEYVPFKRFLPKFFLPNGVDCTPGIDKGIIQLNGLPPFEAKICSEFMHKGHRSMAKHSDSRFCKKHTKQLAKASSKTLTRPLVIQILNNSWFSRQIRYQHQAIDRLRAIERNVTLLRVANK
jgi:apolipoprotein N-acyltransferase